MESDQNTAQLLPETKELSEEEKDIQSITKLLPQIKDLPGPEQQEDDIAAIEPMPVAYPNGGTQVAQSATTSAAQKIKAKYGVKESIITFEAGDNETFTARPLKDGSEIMALERKVKSIKDLCASDPPKEWKPFLPADDEIIRFCVYAEALLVSHPMTFLDALDIAKNCGLLMIEIGGKLVASTSAVATENEVATIEERKKNLKQTSSGARS